LFHFVTNHAFGRHTDGQTEFSSLDRVCIPCSAIKTKLEPLNFKHEVCWNQSQP